MTDILTTPGLYIVALLVVLMLVAWGLMQWNRRVVRLHRQPHSEAKDSRSFQR